ncbi:hypothetical protein ACXVUM_13250 [Williamsia sp. SKLECPSW1]
MSDRQLEAVPMWTLATQEVDLPAVIGDEALPPARLDALRGVLAVLSETPIATLEAHSIPSTIDRSRAVNLASASPLAQQLTQLVKQTPKVATDGGETLYRMVVPAKFAAQMGSGIVAPMKSSAVSGGMHSALMSGNKIVGQTTMVPVSAGAAGGAAVATAGALTIAAPLILMAVAVGVSAHADQQRQKAIEHITELLEKLHVDKLADEQHTLNGCKSSITKAAAILLDKGQLGASLGLDSAVHTIDTALERARSRIAKWEKALNSLGDERVELQKLTAAIPTVDQEDGEFSVHRELATAALAMKRRVLVLQAVDHAQRDGDNPFERFIETLRMEQHDLDELQRRLDGVLNRLSTLQLDRSHGVRDFMFTSGEVDKLLHASERMRALGSMTQTSQANADVVIDMIQNDDGSVTVLPAIAA